MAIKLALLALALGAVAACTDAKHDDAAPVVDEDATFAADGTDTTAADTDAQLIASSLVAAPLGGDVTLASLEGARAVYLPRVCLDVVSAGDQTTYTFDHCLGPNGLRNVSGSLVTRSTALPGHLRLDLTATGFTINGATADWTATAEVTADGANRMMTWTATMDGTSAGGRKFSHASRFTVAWTLGEACFELNGTSDGQVRQREIKTEISKYRRCKLGCPEADGWIAITNVTKGKTIRVDYDGTAFATFTGPKGNATKVTLLCVP